MSLEEGVQFGWMFDLSDFAFNDTLEIELDEPKFAFVKAFVHEVEP